MNPAAPRNRLAGRRPRPIDYDAVPICTYTDPEIAWVGTTEDEARKRRALGRARRWCIAAFAAA